MAASRREMPEWWDWDIHLTPHVRKRMLDRGFNEIALRIMLSEATGYEPQEDGRKIVFAEWEYRPWQIIVEPDASEEVLVVITAYPTD
jgi:hypothetical protein